MADTLTKLQRSACMRAIKGRNTKPELIVRSALHRLGCRFSLHRSDLHGRPDIVMPARNAVVFVHGCFWHGHVCRHGRRKPASNVAYWTAKLERNRERDRRAVKALRKAGWRVLVVWECQTRDADSLGARLCTFLNPAVG
jgi:DNA mismatch endonuclease (patch repair protein)